MYAKRIAAALMALLLTVGAGLAANAPIVADIGTVTVAAEGHPMSGDLGLSQKWELSSDGTLTITGDGSLDSSPWLDWSDDVKKAVIGEGITEIGFEVFMNCDKMTELVLPETLEKINENAFSGCKSLKSVVIPKNVKTIRRKAFAACNSLSDVTILSMDADPSGVGFGYTDIPDETSPFGLLNKPVEGFTVKVYKDSMAAKYYKNISDVKPVYLDDDNSSADESKAETSSKKEETSSEKPAESSSKKEDVSSVKPAESSSKKEDVSSEKPADSSSKKEDVSSMKPADSSSKKEDTSSKADEKKAVKGDANGDGEINVTDIAVVAAHIKGIKALDQSQIEAADVNGDKEVNVTDIAMIAAHIKGIKALV